MDQFWLGLLKELGGQWVAIAGILLWLIYKSGIVPRVLGIEAKERAQLSKDTQDLIDRLHEQIARLDKRIDAERAECDKRSIEERADCERRLMALRVECDREIAALRDDMTLLVKGEARWRHLVGNLAQHIAALRNELHKAGIDIPEFTGWGEFISEGGFMLPQQGDGE